MANRTRTVINLNHPHNIMHAIGENAKNAVRQMSNDELDTLIKENMSDHADLENILAMPRHRKIKMIKNSAMKAFAEEYQKARQPKEEAKADA